MYNFSGKINVGAKTVFYNIVKNEKFKIDEKFEGGYNFIAFEKANEKWQNYFKIKITKSAFNAIKKAVEFETDKFGNLLNDKAFNFKLQDAILTFKGEKSEDGKFINILKFLKIDNKYLVLDINK